MLLPNHVAGRTWGTFTADFVAGQLSNVDMFLTIDGDTTYEFNNDIWFGEYSSPIFPGISFFEAPLETYTPGAFGASKFYMDFTKEKTDSLFVGDLDGVHSSFGFGVYALALNDAQNASVPEPSPLLLMPVSAFLFWSARRKA